jgi:spectinomycin phosphotransferase
MLEKPDVDDARITACLWDNYRLRIARIEFLPLGADPHTAVYRAVTQASTPYFVKLRRGSVDEVALMLAQFLAGTLAQIIAPLPAGSGRLCANLAPFALILYPYVEGRTGYEVELSPRQWCDFGAAIKQIHTTDVPEALRARLPRETYGARWRDQVTTVLGRIAGDALAEAAPAKLVELLEARRSTIVDLVRRAERLAQSLQHRTPEFVVCHSDLHAGNLLIDGTDALYIVDWDSPILAPKERDLMFIGGAQGFRNHTPQQETTGFYAGYGATQIDSRALAYYRYERIVEDIAVICEQLMSTAAGGEDWDQSLRHLAANFAPGGTIAVAYASDEALRREGGG